VLKCAGPAQGSIQRHLRREATGVNG
jgi:hypothetical protein